MSSRKEIRDEVLRIADLTNAQHGTLVNESINATILEIAHPAWAYAPRREVQHNWSWLRRTTSFTTVASQEDYVLGREIGDIYLMRHIDDDRVLQRWSDERFYKEVPDPQETGTPSIYRVRHVDGVDTRLAAADTIDVVSSSASDDGDADLQVTVWGYVGGRLTSENYTLDGTSTVSGTNTFQAREIFVSKTKDTTGNITVTENSGGTTLVVLGPKERMPLMTVISLYRIPSAAKTVHVHFYTHVRTLNNDSDAPQFGGQWHYVVRLGALSKIYQSLNKEQSFLLAQRMYSSAVRAMIASDQDDPDLVARLESHDPFLRRKGNVHLRRATDAIA